MKEITITFSEVELDGIILALKTSIQHLQEQKESISGALIGHSKIDNICRDIETIKEKIERSYNATKDFKMNLYSNGYDHGMIDALIMILRHKDIATKEVLFNYMADVFGWSIDKAESYINNIELD